jgi:2-methylcitrate dehydratase PrpD
VKEVSALASWASALRWQDAPRSVRDRLELVLLDTLAVTMLGASLPEQRNLVEVWDPPPGPAPLFGADHWSTVDVAAQLNAIALVSLELDEGNKYARGHPAAHGFPAVLALASQLDTDGAGTASALLVAYEVAARFGRATRLRPDAHPHGNWGVAGAAAGCARLLGLTAERTAAAIDAGSAMPIAGHFSSALDGNPVRNAWMAASNSSGLLAARFAQAGMARDTGSAAYSLGTMLGEFDPAQLVDELGERWDILNGYFKRHASCSYTHPAADAVLGVRADGVREILVETHSLGAGLNRTTWDSRLGAMFSIPYAVSAALIHGSVRPSSVDDPEVRELAGRVRVEAAADLDRRLPTERAARVTIRTAAGEIVREVPNPVGDADFEPFDGPGLRALLADLLGSAHLVERISDIVHALPTAAHTRSLLEPLGRSR